jgi:hypothetical protein
MKNEIITLLDEILKFENVERDNTTEQKLLMNEIEDIEKKIKSLESSSLLEGVIDEIVQSLQETSDELEQPSISLMTNHTMIPIESFEEQSNKLESRVFIYVYVWRCF